MKNISFQQALDLIKSIEIESVGKEKVFINESVGRILSNDIHSKESSPKFDTSNMDGYALNYDDLEILKKDGLIIDSINKAGNTDNCTIKKGFCIKTFTGSKMPQNADSLAIIEQVEVKENRIFLKKNENIEKNQHIRKKGENYTKDLPLFKKGKLITPLDIGLLAQNSNVMIEVFRKIRVGILSSGDEIIELGERSESENFIYSSNNHILSAITKSLGCDVSLYGILKDDKEVIKNEIQNALNDNDIVITTGGMSKGDFDFTKEIVGNLGESIFSGVKIKPGKVISYIKCKNNKHIFALPGNPLSSVISFMLFGRLIIQKLLSLEPNITFYKAKLLNPIVKKDIRTEFIASKVFLENGIFAIEPQSKSSYMIDNLNGALAVVDRDFEINELIDIILFDDLLKIN